MQIKQRMEVFEGIFQQAKDILEDSLLADLLKDAKHFKNVEFQKQIEKEIKKRLG